MAWEKRQKASYYYRSQRDSEGRVRKVYLGAGPAARLAATKDDKVRESRLADVSGAMAFEANYEPTDRLMEELEHRVDLLVDAVLLSNGFHRHKGAWRRSREFKTTTKTTEK